MLGVIKASRSILLATPADRAALRSCNDGAIYRRTPIKTLSFPSIQAWNRSAEPIFKEIALKRLPKVANSSIFAFELGDIVWIERITEGTTLFFDNVQTGLFDGKNGAKKG